MVKESYAFRSDPTFRLFMFESIGTKGVIVKMVVFQKNPNRKNYWNLAFGDLEAGKMNDRVVSNNGDLVKVLSTLVKITRAFFAQNPAAVLEIAPVDEKRKELYNHLFRRHFHEMEPEINLSGWRNDEKLDYRPESIFDSFELSAKYS